MKSKVITLPFFHKFSLLLRQEDFTGSFPLYPDTFSTQIWAALTRRFETRARVHKITSSNPWTRCENVDRRKGEVFFYPMWEKKEVSFKEWPWARHSTLIFSTQLLKVKVSYVFRLCSFLVRLGRKCDCAARNIRSEILLSANKSLCKSRIFCILVNTPGDIGASSVPKYNPNLEPFENLSITFT